MPCLKSKNCKLTKKFDYLVATARIIKEFEETVPVSAKLPKMILDGCGWKMQFAGNFQGNFLSIIKTLIINSSYWMFLDSPVRKQSSFWDEIYNITAR